MGKNIFHPCFCKHKNFDIEKVNFDQENQKGTCELTSKKNDYVMIWSIQNYPAEDNMAGAPYPLQVDYTIFCPSEHKHKALKSVSGKFVYELNGGVLPNLSALGIPCGNYKSVARNNMNDNILKVNLSLEDGCYELNINVKN
jgi:hypothetical protein